MHRKVHPNAKLKTLDPEIQEELWAWFVEHPDKGLKEACEWLKITYSVETRIQRMSEWRDWYARKVELELADSETRELEEMLSKPHLQLQPAQITAISNAVFLNKASKLGDAKTFVQVAGVIQRSQELQASQQGHSDKMDLARAKLDLQLKEHDRKMKELEMKVADFEKKVADSKDDQKNPDLSEAERAKRMRARFGV